MLNRKLVIVAILAALPALAFAQTPSHKMGTAVNPDDSGYHAVVTENPYQPKALPGRASSSAMMPMTVNPEDSGYHAAITENPYKGKPAGSGSSLTSTFRAVTNPEDSGYLGPVN